MATYSFKFPFTEKAKPLYLVGAGMRRKNLYVVEVDIYKVGLALSESAIDNAQVWVQNQQHSVISQYILSNPVPSTSPIAKYPRAAILIHFVRAITKQQFVEAFRESFQGVDPAEFDALSNVLDRVFDERIGAGSEFGFYWLNDGEVVFTKGKEVTGRINNPVVATRLMDVYSDPKRAVSKSLQTSIETNITVINELLKNKQLALK